MSTTETSRVTTAELRRLMWRWAIVLAVLGVFAVWATWRMTTAAARLPDLSGAAPAAPRIDYWTCTMHPEVRLPQAGKCPVCGMGLVPKYAGSDEPGVAPTAMAHAGHEHAAPRPAAPQQMWYRCTMPECGDVGSADPESRCPVCGMKREPVGMVGDDTAGDHEVTLSERARRLAALETEAVQRRSLIKHIRTVGKIGYDETRYKMVSAWVAGRIDQLFADFTGMVVAQGDHLVKIYSPELLSAQEEYLQALRSSGSMSAASDVARRSAEQLHRSARRKLELLGVADAQIATLEESGTPQTHLVVFAPLGGTIVAKRAMEGMYVKTGDVLYSIADLTHVWLLLDVYEADLVWIRPFQDVLVTAQALPGEQFHGQIAFVDPVVDKLTRTVGVRVNVANPGTRLKPEMFVTAEIVVPLGSDGRAVAPQPGGEYACPMHPWETAATQARCPVCEMPLVPIASIPGYAPAASDGADRGVLSVPRSAILQTGERSLAYVEAEPGRYHGVEVNVGPLARAPDGAEYYAVLSGLDEGQQVVTRGNFAIDSQMQLAGKPSLFQPADPGKSAAPAPADAHTPADPRAADDAAESDAAAPELQTTCPVMVGNPIDKDVYTDHAGVRVYFCCPPCVAKFKAEPEKYIPNLPASVQAAIRQAAAHKELADD